MTTLTAILRGDALFNSRSHCTREKNYPPHEKHGFFDKLTVQKGHEHILQCKRYERIMKCVQE